DGYRCLLKNDVQTWPEFLRLALFQGEIALKCGPFKIKSRSGEYQYKFNTKTGKVVEGVIVINNEESAKGYYFDPGLTENDNAACLFHEILHQLGFGGGTVVRTHKQADKFDLLFDCRAEYDRVYACEMMCFFPDQTTKCS